MVTLHEDAAARYGFAAPQRKIDRELAVGWFIDCPPELTVEAISRLKAIGATWGLLIVPGHDPDVWLVLTRQLGVPSP